MGLSICKSCGQHTNVWHYEGLAVVMPLQRKVPFLGLLCEEKGISSWSQVCLVAMSTKLTILVVFAGTSNYY